MPPSNSSPSDLSTVFAALADPSRRQILEHLSRGEATVGEVAEPLEMSAPAVSKHLRVLRDAGLLGRRIDGRTHHLKLKPEPLRTAREWIESYRHFWETSLDQLADYLERGISLETNTKTETVASLSPKKKLQKKSTKTRDDSSHS